MAFLQRIAEIESRIHALLEGSLTANLAVGAVAWHNPSPLMEAVEEVEANAEIVPSHMLALAQEAKTRVAQYAASLVEPDVGAGEGREA